MSAVKTNNVSLIYAIESSLGVLPGSPVWKVVEWNSLDAFGKTIENKARRPVTKDRGRRKGTIIDSDSPAEFGEDITLDAFNDFAEGFMFSEFANVEFDFTHSKMVGAALNVTATGYAFGAQLSTLTNGTLLAGKMVYTLGGAITLIYAKGYAIAGNNGLKPLDADVTGTSTEATAAGLATETAPANAWVGVAGLRTDDLTLTISGSTATLVSAGDITNWATYGLSAGQYIHIGSATAAGAVQNAYSTNTVYGYARITSISGATLNLDKLDSHLIGGPHSPATIDVLFGRFVRNVQVTAAADDNRYLERSYQFEAAFPDLDGVGTPAYEYSVGNYANELTLNLPLTDFVTGGFAFVGKTSEDITTSRKTGASSARSPLRTTAIGTSTDMASITTDLVSSASDVCFQSITMKVSNGVTGQKCLGTLGPTSLNVGQFTVSIEGQMLFTRKEIVNAIRNNTTVTFACILKNEDGAIAIDMPQATVGNGGREFPLDESILVNITLDSFTGTTYPYDMGITVFAVVPTVRT